MMVSQVSQCQMKSIEARLDELKRILTQRFSGGAKYLELLVYLSEAGWAADEFEEAVNAIANRRSPELGVLHYGYELGGGAIREKSFVYTEDPSRPRPGPAAEFLRRVADLVEERERGGAIVTFEIEYPLVRTESPGDAFESVQPSKTNVKILLRSSTGWGDVKVPDAGN